MASKAGGGRGSRQVHSGKSAAKVEPRAQGIRPGHAAQIGLALGNKAQESGSKRLNPVIAARTAGYNPPIGAQTNAKPTIHPNGGQGQHGPVAGTPAPAGRDILSAFGPDSAGVRARR
jgi:hypothetical protein